MGKITKEEARGVLENYLVEQTRKKTNTLEIKDFRPGDESGVYSADGIENCFIVHVPDNNCNYVGVSHIIGISKETGKIVIDGRFGE